MEKVFVIGLSILANVVKSCKAPAGGINPATQVDTASGVNNTLHSEALYNSIKTTATINLSGHIGTLITFSVILLLIIGVYKKLSDFLGLVNDRLHNVAALFGVHGFAYRQPAVNVEDPQDK